MTGGLASVQCSSLERWHKVGVGGGFRHAHDAASTSAQDGRAFLLHPKRGWIPARVRPFGTPHPPYVYLGSHNTYECRTPCLERWIHFVKWRLMRLGSWFMNSEMIWIGVTRDTLMVYVHGS